MIKSCYIHIPFCEHICSYCDFCKLLYNEKIVDSYLEYLEKEIKSIYKNETLDTIYIGGGTPTALNINQLKKLFKIISYLKRSSNCEFSIEANFENTTEEKLKLMKDNGVNRLSFGLETINKKNLKFLERNYSESEIKKIIDIARKIGFSNINVDLIYAIPKETLYDLEQDLDFIYSLNVEHISCYSLMIENHTKLKIAKVESISEELDYKMYKLICTKMKEKNYNHYEISNYSKNGFESKHNLVYWNNLNYYGFGLGASSYIKNKRITNTRSLTNYLKGKYILETINLDKQDLIEYEIMLKLRTKQGINLDEFNKKYGKYINHTDLLELKLLKKIKNFLFIPEDKWYISNEIILRILEGEVNNE